MYNKVDSLFKYHVMSKLNFSYIFVLNYILYKFHIECCIIYKI